MPRSCPNSSCATPECEPAGSLFPGAGDPQLVGIARLRTLGSTIAEGHEVEYFTLPARSILNRCTVARMPFEWTINPYRGCEFACKYCYARYTHEFMELRDPREFEHKIYVKQNSAPGHAEFERFADPAIGALLRRDLRRVKPGEQIAIGTATDPYQPAERRYGVTRAILEEFARHRGLDIGIVTKSNLVLRDSELLREIAGHNQLFVNLTITTLDTNLARILEPRAPRPDLRLDAVRRLTQAGVPAGVICAPVVPGITDAPRDLDALVKATREAGGQYIFANALFLKPCSAAIFLPWLEKEFPQLVENYRRRFESRAFLPDAYRKRLSSLMAALRKKHGFTAKLHPQRKDNEETRLQGIPPARSAAPQGEQMALFRSA